MGILENSIAYMRENFPEVTIERCVDGVIFRGRFCIEGKKDDFSIQIAPLLALTMPINYPISFPTTCDIENIVTYDHKFTNGNLCVATAFDLQLNLENSGCISDYIEKYLIPYFISYEYWKENNKDIYGDRSHGLAGVFESIQDFFHVSKEDHVLFLRLITWASKKQKFKRCIPELLQAEYRRKYNSKISKIRKLGIERLRAIYKLFNIHSIKPKYTSSDSEIEGLINKIYS